VIRSLAHQQSGHTSMEITLEFEDTDIIVAFEPEFDLSINCVDIEKVQWNFQDGNHTRVVADVFSNPQISRSRRTSLLPDLRLCN
jgi:hypothetical protein